MRSTSALLVEIELSFAESLEYSCEIEVEVEEREEEEEDRECTCTAYSVVRIVRKDAFRRTFAYLMHIEYTKYKCQGGRTNQ